MRKKQNIKYQRHLRTILRQEMFAIQTEMYYKRITVRCTIKLTISHISIEYCCNLLSFVEDLQRNLLFSFIDIKIQFDNQTTLKKIQKELFTCKYIFLSNLIAFLVAKYIVSASKLLLINYFTVCTLSSSIKKIIIVI